MSRPSLVAVVSAMLVLGGLAGPTRAGGGTTTSAGDDELPQDELVLSNGRRVKGHVVFQTDAELVVRVGTRDRTFAREDVAELELYRDRWLRALDAIDALPYGGVGLTFEAAQQLEQWGVQREARILYWTVLAFDAQHEGAHRALGHRHSGKNWRAYRDGRGKNFDDLIEASSDWGSAWEFSTTHFRVRSNLSLAHCLGLALDLERIYRVFYDLFGEEFGLYEILEPMEVYAHADRASYPELSGDLGGYFSGVDNRVYFDASRGIDRSLLAHEASHALLYNTVYRTRRKEGSLPGWLDEGLAQYLQAAVDVSRMRLEFLPGRTPEGWLAIHAQAPDPFELGRMLNLQQSDFRGPQAALMYAQAWSLVQFCLHGDEGRYRDGFVRFVASCYRGKSSPTHFEKAMELDKEDLDEAWRAWLAEVSGR